MITRSNGRGACVTKVFLRRPARWPSLRRQAAYDMKRHALSNAVMALLIALGSHCFAESPEEFAHRFCVMEQSLTFRGLPQGRDELRIGQLLGSELIRAIRDANRSVDLWIERHRDSKENLMIPHIEKNLFDGFDEGPTTFRVGRVSIRSGKRVVAIHREYRDHSKVYSWTDHLILDRDAEGWVVADLDTHYWGSVLGYLGSFRKGLSEAPHDREGANR